MDHSQDPASTGYGKLAQGLGWFSIGLGLAELLAPRALADTLGLKGQEKLIQLYGLREIAAGVGILASRDPTPWLWGRVAGDALDIATLGAGLADEEKRPHAAVAAGAVLGVTALDMLCAQGLAKERQGQRDAGARSIAAKYANRSGFPAGAQAARGAVRDFEVPPDYRVPELMRPWTEIQRRSGTVGGVQPAPGSSPSSVDL